MTDNNSSSILPPIVYIELLAEDLEFSDVEKEKLLSGADGLIPYPDYEKWLRDNFKVPGTKELAVS